MFVKFEPPTNKFVVHQTPSLRPFKKKKKSKPNKLCAITSIWFLFPLTFWLKNLWA